MRIALKIIAVVCSLASLTGCAKRSDGSEKKKAEELQALLHKAEERETALKDEVTQLTQRMTRLQNDFKLYSEKPCDFELDPIQFTIEKKAAQGIAHRPAAMTTSPAGMEAKPSGPPAELSDVNDKIRQSRREIRVCYQASAKKSVELQTSERRVQLAFNVRPSGQVDGVMVSPPVGFGFEDCIRSLISGWRFSRFQGQSQRFRAWMNLRPQ